MISLLLPCRFPWSLQHEAVPSHPCSLVLSWVTPCVLLSCCHSVSVLPQRGDICKLSVRLAECRLLDTNQRKAVKTEDWKKLSMSKDWMRWSYLAWRGEDWARPANSLQRQKCLFSKGKEEPIPFFSWWKRWCPRSKLQQERFWLDDQKSLLILRKGKYWNRKLGDTAVSPSLEV